MVPVFYSGIKKNGIITLAGKWTGPKIIFVCVCVCDVKTEKGLGEKRRSTGRGRKKRKGSGIYVT